MPLRFAYASKFSQRVGYSLPQSLLCYLNCFCWLCPSYEEYIIIGHSQAFREHLIITIRYHVSCFVTALLSHLCELFQTRSVEAIHIKLLQNFDYTTCIYRCFTPFTCRPLVLKMSYWYPHYHVGRLYVARLCSSSSRFGQR